MKCWSKLFERNTTCSVFKVAEWSSRSTEHNVHCYKSMKKFSGSSSGGPMVVVKSSKFTWRSKTTAPSWWFVRLAHRATWVSSSETRRPSPASGNRLRTGKWWRRNEEWRTQAARRRTVECGDELWRRLDPDTTWTWWVLPLHTSSGRCNLLIRSSSLESFFSLRPMFLRRFSKVLGSAQKHHKQFWLVAQLVT